MTKFVCHWKRTWKFPVNQGTGGLVYLPSLNAFFSFDAGVFIDLDKQRIQGIPIQDIKCPIQHPDGSVMALTYTNDFVHESFSIGEHGAVLETKTIGNLERNFNVFMATFSTTGNELLVYGRPSSGGSKQYRKVNLKANPQNLEEQSSPGLAQVTTLDLLKCDPLPASPLDNDIPWRIVRDFNHPNLYYMLSTTEVLWSINTKTNQFNRILDFRGRFRTYDLVSTPSGWLIMSCQSKGIHAIDPRTGECHEMNLIMTEPETILESKTIPYKTAQPMYLLLSLPSVSPETTSLISECFGGAGKSLASIVVNYLLEGKLFVFDFTTDAIFSFVLPLFFLEPPKKSS